jgi:hypothetical protein
LRELLRGIAGKSLSSVLINGNGGYAVETMMVKTVEQQLR